MYKQFAITIASRWCSRHRGAHPDPALCAVLLRPRAGGRTSIDGGVASAFNRIFDRFNRGFRAVTERYLGAAARVIDRPPDVSSPPRGGGRAVVRSRAVRTGPASIPARTKGYFGMLIELPDNAGRPPSVPRRS